MTRDSAATDDASQEMSQDASIKAEPETQDVVMEDDVAVKPKVNLEQLFDDEDSDEEFPSSAPAATAPEEEEEEAASQPAPMYGRPRREMTEVGTC